jgi:hypothetical protein
MFLTRQLNMSSNKKSLLKLMPLKEKIPRENKPVGDIANLTVDNVISEKITQQIIDHLWMLLLEKFLQLQNMSPSHQLHLLKCCLKKRQRVIKRNLKTLLQHEFKHEKKPEPEKGGGNDFWSSR